MSEEKSSVLIVDDSPDDIHFIMEHLKDEYAVIAATSGKQALEMVARDKKPDVVLMDVMMPEMDGYETCRKIKSDPSAKHIDVIFVSAHNTTEEILAGYDAGGCDYLVKPVQPDELIKKVSLAIENRRSNVKLQNEKNEVFNAFMVALTGAGEAGEVISFFRESFTLKSIIDLADKIVEVLARFKLSATVQIESGGEFYYSGRVLPIRPLEKELLMRLTDQDRIKEYGKRAMFKFGGVSILIKDMPDDDDYRGRLRDHIALLLEGAEAKLLSLEMDEKLAGLIIDANQALESIYTKQEEYKKTGQRIMDSMMENLEKTFISWGLSEEQENQLLQLVENGINQSLEHFEKGTRVDQEMQKIITQLGSIH